MAIKENGLQRACDEVEALGDGLALTVAGPVRRGPALLTNDGRPFTLATRRTGAGDASRSCESPKQVIRKVHDRAGIEGAGAIAAGRTFGVCLHRKGFDLPHIREVPGLATFCATKALVEGDPVNLGRIVAGVIRRRYDGTQ